MFKITKRAAIETMIAVAAVGAVALTVSIVQSPPSSATAEAPTADPVAVSEVSSRFAEASDPADALPGFLAKGPQAHSELVGATTRFLGEFNGAEFWIAQDETGNPCLLALLPGKAEIASHTCGPAETVAKQGLSLEVSDETVKQNYRIHLIPEGFTAAADNYTPVGDQLFVANGYEKETTGVTMTSDTGRGAPVQLRAFDAVDAGTW